MCASTSISHTVTPFMCLCPVCTSVWVAYNSSNKFTHHPLLVNICPVISVACHPNKYTICYHLHSALFYTMCSFAPKCTIDTHTTSPVPSAPQLGCLCSIHHHLHYSNTLLDWLLRFSKKKTKSKGIANGGITGCIYLQTYLRMFYMGNTENSKKVENAHDKSIA